MEEGEISATQEDNDQYMDEEIKDDNQYQRPKTLKHMTN
jgi:hypothetical protein